MPSPERTVRQLRLTARDSADVRRVLPTIEDALRCATLGDDGARLIVVRQLALGRIAANVSPQALSRHIEHQVARSGWAIVPADDGAAPAGTACVSFASRLQARVALARRLVQGDRCDAWYWRLAVPECAASATPPMALKRMAETVVAWPEARSAWPRWCASVVEAGGTALLRVALSPAQGSALAARAGMGATAAPLGASARHVASMSPAEQRPVAHGAAEADVAARAATPASAAQEEIAPPWLVHTLRAGGHHSALRQLLGTPASTGPSMPSRPPAEKTPAPSPHDAHDPRSPHRRPAPPASTAAPCEVHAAPAVSASIGPGPLLSTSSPLSKASRPRTAAPPYLAPTAFGGLTFLLPVLARLGLPEWLQADERIDGGRFVASVFAHALHRLHAPPGDPAWRLTITDTQYSHDRSASSTPAPARWRDPLLRAPSRGAARALADELAAAANLEAQAFVWLTAARRWLRRAGRIGLASLVQRPARLALSPTHIDLHFDLSATDLRVRRLGLDLDPGWLPWLGRVVSFHFSERQP